MHILVFSQLIVFLSIRHYLELFLNIYSYIYSFISDDSLLLNSEVSLLISLPQNVWLLHVMCLWHKSILVKFIVIRF